MRKIKTKGLKIKVKHVDRGPRFAVALHSCNTPGEATEALVDVFDINDALAKVVLGATPVVICRDLDQAVASEYVKKLKDAGDFRVWLESAAGKMKQMNLKQRNGRGDAPLPKPQIRKH